MASILIEANGTPFHVQPQNIAWQTRTILAKDGEGAPIYGAYSGCAISMSLSYNMNRSNFSQWYELMDSETHTFTLPHPVTALMTTFTGYVDLVEGRFDVRDECQIAMVGLDVTLSRLVVTL